MSCIVGIVGIDNYVYMGCDSCMTTENGDIRYTCKSKIIEKNGFLIGVVGSPIGIQLLNDNDIGNDIRQLPYIIKKIFNDNECMEIIEDSKLSPCHFLIGHKHRLYELDSEFCLNEYTDNYHIIGSGDQYALGYLDGVSTYKDIVAHSIEFDCIVGSIKCASKYCSGVGGAIKTYKI